MMKYGSIERTQILDENGSVVIRQTNYRGGAINSPQRVRYNIRMKVADQKQEFEEYAKFSDELQKNKGMFDPSWSWDTTPKGTFIIKSYTVLEY